MSPVILLVVLAIVAAVVYWFGRRYLAGMWERRMLAKAKRLVMFEVLVPKQRVQPQEGEAPTQNQETISVMEQFLTGLAGFYQTGSKGWWWQQPIFTLELIAVHGEIRFYIGTPADLASAVEKQVLAFYPDAQLDRNVEYRIAEKGYAVAGSQLRLANKFIFPIKTYRQVESDPLENITSSLSKLGTDTRAMIQLLIVPTNNNWRMASEKATRTLQEGKSLTMASSSKWIKATHAVLNAVGGDQKSEPDKPRAPSPVQEQQQKAIGTKASLPGFRTTVNVVTVAPQLAEAEIQLASILSAFSQYNDPTGNSFRARKVRNFQRFLTSTLLRAPFGKPMILTTDEITSIFHMPNAMIDTPGIRWLLARFAPAPPSMPTSGEILVGENEYRGVRRSIYMGNKDRGRHTYCIGMTGVGKSTFFENLALQDIRAGRGVCVIDPHGQMVENILLRMPKERANDVIYFDPGDLERPMGLNLLEWKHPEERDFLINEWINIFYKLFDPNRTGMVGPQFEHWGRNASLTVMANPEGGTLIEIPRLFTDDGYRDQLLKHVTDPMVLAFWNQQMAKTADFHKSEMFNYFISKFGRFMTSELMRNIIGQPTSAFNFRDVMDSGKVLLINLSKGKIGDINANMLGMIIVAKIYSAALSRQDMPEEQRRDFYMYVDEFQNLATDTFASILSEARKYHLTLNITHQYIGQLSEEIRNAIIGNVGTLVCYRIGVPDAEFLGPQFTPVFEQSDMINIEKYHAYIKTLVDLSPVRPFSVRMLKDETQPNGEIAKAVMELSRLTYGKPKAEIDAMIRERAKIEDNVGAATAVVGMEPKGGV